jgi:hypothetical protein
MANDCLTVGRDPSSSPNLTACNYLFFDIQVGNLEEDSRIATAYTCTVPNTGCPKMLPTVVQPMVTLYKMQENYFEGHSMEQRANEDYNCEKNTIQKLSDHTS